MQTQQPIESALRAFVAASSGSDAAQVPVSKLKGDASSRSYYRVSSEPSHVVMVMPPDMGPAFPSAPQLPVGDELPFVNVHRYLRALGVRVPDIRRYAPERGLMLLEDLGDVTLEAALRREPSSLESLYGRAIDLLAGLRARADRERDPGCIAYNRAFEAPLYEWELHHFREWGLEARYGRTLPASERRRLDELFREIANGLAAEPRGFTHRDYQSRNLMLHRGELVVIDFQDALLGPRQYDLVALLRDSYVQLDRPFIEKMLDRYLATYAAAGGERLDRARFIEVFDLLTIQRKLKDAGRFEYISRVKGNPSFLPFVQPSLGYVRAAFERVPAAAELRALLAPHVPELQAP